MNLKFYVLLVHWKTSENDNWGRGSVDKASLYNLKNIKKNEAKYNTH